MREPVEDLIDFPCSDTFRGFFYERGLTPHPPSDMGDNLMKTLINELRELRGEIAAVVAQSLETPVRPSQSESRPSQAPPAPAPAPTRRPIWNSQS